MQLYSNILECAFVYALVSILSAILHTVFIFHSFMRRNMFYECQQVIHFLFVTTFR